MLRIYEFFVLCMLAWQGFSTWDCCVSKGPQELLKCVEGSLEQSNASLKLNDIHVVTYVTENIALYSAYSLAINSMYCRTRGYSLSIFSPEMGSEYEPRDQRWNRVKILSEGLNPKSGAFRDAKYVVWVDADLIFTDMDYRLEAIIASHGKDTDIIISAERHAGTGVANTGCFIVRNTEWTRAWLERWWQDFDHTEAHDQIMFDRLYKRQLPESAEHIAILPAHVLNSVPPASLFQEEDHRILHLMGNPDDLRARIFKAGFTELCRAKSTGSAPARQLGLDRQYLQDETLQFLLGTLVQARDRLADVASRDPAGIALQTLLTEIRESLIQIQKYELTQAQRNDVGGMIELLYDYARDAVRRGLGYSLDSTLVWDDYVGATDSLSATSLLAQCEKSVRAMLLERSKQQQKSSSLPPPPARDPETVVNWWNALAVYGSDVMHVTRLIPTAEVALGGGKGNVTRVHVYADMHHQVICDVGTALAMLLVLVTPESRIIVLEMQARWMAEAASQASTLTMRVSLLEEAVAMFDTSPTMNQYHRLPLMQELGTLLCQISGRHDDALTIYEQLIAMHDALLYAEKQYKQDHLVLAQSLILAGKCARTVADVSNIDHHEDDVLVAVDVIVNAGNGTMRSVADRADKWIRRADVILSEHSDKEGAKALRAEHDLSTLLALSGQRRDPQSDEPPREDVLSHRRKVYRRQKRRSKPHGSEGK